ncbi:phosphoribosyltransferase [uncultured Pseudomonas sp.]|uniref:phosphoribosyltransferase n=1 Tax=uncultured Pseudomonas sp. TaxID=114707 RepID=UPI0025DFDC64|nr:phosphoribosyltransferase [uncultured Pseudomonas sp.]
MDRWIASLQPALLEEAFSCVIGILRGGGPLALMVSHTIGVVPAFLRYQRSGRSVTWDSSIPVPAPGSKVLLCEDIAGAGHTLKDCSNYLQRLGLQVKILTAGFDDLSVTRPDYGLDGRGYQLQFPWERQAYTAAYRNRWQDTHGRHMAQDHEYDVYALDLDGILLPDIPLEYYAADLQGALAQRDHLEPFGGVPPWGQVKAIVTGRPEMDRLRTEDWLSRHGYGAATLIMRDTQVYNDTPQQVAAHKARAIVQLACTHFVESDPVQAILIAQQAPLLRVIWWHAQSRQGRLVGAVSWSNPSARF